MGSNSLYRVEEQQLSALFMLGAEDECPDLVIIPEGGMTAMLVAFKAIIDSGGPEGELQFLGES